MTVKFCLFVSGEVNLPSVEEMKADISNKRNAMSPAVFPIQKTYYSGILIFTQTFYIPVLTFTVILNSQCLNTDISSSLVITINIVSFLVTCIFHIYFRHTGFRT